MNRNIRFIVSILLFIVIVLSEWLLGMVFPKEFWESSFVVVIKRSLVIATGTWVLIEAVGLIKHRLLKRYDLSHEDNLHSRKLHTQINLLEKVLVFIIILSAVGLILVSIEGIREIGIGIFASAGVAGIIIGLSAQKIVGALLAGVQIAITQPFKLDDAVLVENEWGWIEEINLTFVVVRIWDKRRLILPSTYFLEKPFQNWTMTTADLIGTVFLYTDYSISVDVLRKLLTKILEGSTLWDGKVNVVQVTDTKDTHMEIRILVSAKNSPTLWDLRVDVREKMIKYIQDNHPQSFPKTRVLMEGN